MKYVIHYRLAGHDSYFRFMTAFGPAFGATIDETPRFDTRIDAAQMFDRFPVVPAACSFIEEVAP